MRRKKSPWPEPTPFQTALMASYINHRACVWAWEDKKKALPSAKDRAPKKNLKPWLVYHG